MKASGCVASIDEVKMTEDPGCILGRASCTRRKGATTFTERVLSKRWAATWAIESTASPWNAALFTRTSFEILVLFFLILLEVFVGEVEVAKFFLFRRRSSLAAAGTVTFF